MRNLSDPRTQLRAAVPGARAHRARSSRRSPRRRPTLFAQPRHDVRARSPTSRGRTCRTRSAAARRRSTRRSRDFPQQRPFLANSEALFHELRPGVARAARPPRRPRRRVRDRHAARCARSVAFNKQPRADVRGARSASPRTRSSRSASTTSTNTAHDPRPDDRLPHAGPDGLQLRDAVVPQRRAACSARATRTAPAQRFIIIAAPQGPNNEGGPSSAPANGGVRAAGQLPAHQPVPEHRLAGPAAGVRGRQRALPRRQAGRSATCPGNQGTPRPRRRSASRASDGSGAATIRRRRASRARTARGASPFAVGARRARRRRASASTSASPSTCRSRTASASRRSSSRRTRSARTRRCASPASTSARSRRSSARPARDAAVVTMEIDDKGLPIHKDATAEDPAAHLPRGQLLRRPPAGHAVGADARRRRHAADHPDRRRRCSSTRCSPRCRATRASSLQDAARRARRRR